MQEEWNELKNWIMDYNKKHSQPIDILKYPGELRTPNDLKLRYCVAISCNDLIQKMEEIEEKWGKVEDGKRN